MQIIRSSGTETAMGPGEWFTGTEEIRLWQGAKPACWQQD
jgi:hypothetical protein